MNRLFAITALVLSVTAGSAMADTRGDFISNPDAYSVLSANKALPNGYVISYDIPVNSKLLGGNTSNVVSVASYGRPLATSIAYARPIAGATNASPVLGMAHSPYARE
jgi:hypothetical protein